jgi:autotransporter-associated beta strand protein
VLNITLNATSGANTYAGNTTISTANATLTLGKADQISNGAGKGNLIITSGTFKMGGFSDTINGLLGNGTVDGVSGAPTLTIGDNDATSTFSGVIKNTAGTLALAKTGNGTLTLLGNNIYSGTTTVSAGILALGASDRIGDTSNLDVAGGTFNLAGFNETLGSITGSGNISLGAGTLTSNSSSNSTFSGLISGTGALVKSGSGVLTLAGNNTQTGDITISAGTLQVASTGLLGGGSYSGNIVNTGAFIIGSNSNQTLSGAISGIGALTKNGTGTLTLSGNNNYSGGTTLNTGTLVIGHANAAGSGTITQTSGSSLLKIDTTGTITNDMSVFNVLASQSATLSGAITVNNATWDIDTGDTLTISGAVSGNGGVTKNGGGTLILSGNNTYLAPTVIDAGTLEAANAGALGSNNTVQVTGGTLLVTADDAINGKNIQMGGSGIGLQFSGNYSGAIGNLTLSANSIIDLGSGSVQILFQGLTSSNHTLSFYNWSGTTLWNGGNGTTDTDKVYFGPDLSDAALAKIYFHSGAVGGGDSFLGSGFELMPQTSFDGGLGYQIIPVPEPETWLAAALLASFGLFGLLRKKFPKILKYEPRS